MMFDPSDVLTTVSLGVFSGRLVSVHSNGDAQVKGFCGPHTVMLPSALLNGMKVGDEVRYYATAMPDGTAVVARLSQTRRR